MAMTAKELQQLLKDNPDLRLSPAADLIEGAISYQKYRAERTQSIKGRTYQSKKEAAEADRLGAMKELGEIKGFITQVPFLLPNGDVHRVDFGILNLDDTVTWREVKGRDLPLGKLKRQIIEIEYDIKIEVV